MSWRARLRVNPWLLAVLAVVVGWSVPKMSLLMTERAEALAFTDCPWRSPARITVTARVTRLDSLPVLAHEQVHAAQCDSLGPLRYRVRNVTARGRMSLEAPAYCAGARQRIRQGQSPRYVRERLFDDAAAAFAGLLDTVQVRAALRAWCPDLAG